jgi:hypothetical protein
VSPFCAHGRYYFSDTPGIGDVVDRDVGSFVGKDLCNATTNSSPGARDESFSLEDAWAEILNGRRCRC